MIVIDVDRFIGFDLMWRCGFDLIWLNVIWFDWIWCLRILQALLRIYVVQNKPATATAFSTTLLSTWVPRQNTSEYFELNRLSKLVLGTWYWVPRQGQNISLEVPSLVACRARFARWGTSTFHWSSVHQTLWRCEWHVSNGNVRSQTWNVSQISGLQFPTLLSSCKSGWISGWCLQERSWYFLSMVWCVEVDEDHRTTNWGLTSEFKTTLVSGTACWSLLSINWITIANVCEVFLITTIAGSSGPRKRGFVYAQNIGDCSGPSRWWESVWTLLRDWCFPSRSCETTLPHQLQVRHGPTNSIGAPYKRCSTTTGEQVFWLHPKIQNVDFW